MFNEWKKPKNSQITNSLPSKSPLNSEGFRKAIYSTNDNGFTQKPKKVTIKNGSEFASDGIETINIMGTNMLLPHSISDHIPREDKSDEIRQESSPVDNQRAIDEIEAEQQKVLAELMGFVVDITRVGNGIATVSDIVSPSNISAPMFKQNDILPNGEESESNLEILQRITRVKSTDSYNEKLIADIETEQERLLREIMSFTANQKPEISPVDQTENHVEIQPNITNLSIEKNDHDLPQNSNTIFKEQDNKLSTPKSEKIKIPDQEDNSLTRDIQITVANLPIMDRSPTPHSIKTPKATLAIIEENLEPFSQDVSPNQKKEGISIFNPIHRTATNSEIRDSKHTGHFAELIPSINEIDPVQTSFKVASPQYGSKAQIVQGSLTKLKLASQSSELEIASIGTPSRPLYSVKKENPTGGLISPLKSPIKSAIKQPTLPRRPVTKAYRRPESSINLEKEIAITDDNKVKLNEDTIHTPHSFRSNKTDFVREPIFGKIQSSASNTHTKQLSNPIMGARHAESLKQSKIEMPSDKQTQLGDSDKQAGGNSGRHAAVKGSDTFTPSHMSSIPSFKKDNEKITINKERRPQLSKLHTKGDETSVIPDQHQSVLKKTGASGFEIGLKSANTIRQSTAKRQLKFAFAREVSSDSSSDEELQAIVDGKGYQMPPKLVVGRKSTTNTGN